jgi:predicted nucleic acid-binding protein
MRELMEKYRDLPMDLADAALVRVAEREGLSCDSWEMRYPRNAAT